MIVFRFIIFLILFLLQGVDIFFVGLAVYFLYEVFLGFDFGFLGSIFFCGG